jgi:hypothetical protein
MFAIQPPVRWLKSARLPVGPLIEALRSYAGEPRIATARALAAIDDPRAASTRQPGVVSRTTGSVQSPPGPIVTPIGARSLTWWLCHDPLRSATQGLLPMVGRLEYIRTIADNDAELRSCRRTERGAIVRVSEMAIGPIVAAAQNQAVLLNLEETC